jgi:homocysteine S-methyltransferase
MSTYLMEKGVAWERCFEELCVSDPDLVASVHNAYLDAGARIIECNSFGSNALRLAKHGLEHRVKELNQQAAQLALHSAAGRPVWVAGSVGPLSFTLQQARENGVDREAIFTEQLSALIHSGLDLLFLETFLDLEEMELALRIKNSLSDCPVLCSFASTADGKLRDGTPLLTAFQRLMDSGAHLVGLNCAHGPQAMLRIVENLPADLPLAVFPNAGYPRFNEGRFQYGTSPEYFARIGVELARQGAKLIGGCCGTSPAHIAALAAALAGREPVSTKPATSVRVESLEVAPAAPPPASTEGSADTILQRLAAGRTVIVTELDTPKTLDLAPYYEGARALTEAGSDAITLADNSLAILRVSNLAVGAVLKQQGITPLLHVACRDRNLLGLQSELMGMAALGIDHVLPLTGDPAKVGDHPGATSVYDVTSIELLKIVQQLNAGVNSNGKSIKSPTRFVSGCTFNPNVKNWDAQLSRLERKIAAGAQYVLTQPVFDFDRLRLLAQKTAQFGIPIFPGIWPLLGGRQAEFLHNEVPGIVIPEAVREKMRGKEGAEGQALGVQIARDLCKEALLHFRSIYLITPFLRYQTTAELAAFIRQETA